MITSISQDGGGSIQEMLRSMRKGQEELTGEGAAESLAVSAQQGSVHTSSSNLMARNFASIDREESKYTAALKGAFAAEEQMTMSRNQVIVASVANAIADAAFWYGDERMRRAKTIKDTVESNEENLKKIRQDIEQKAMEAVANADQPTVAEGSGQGESGEQAPMPEIYIPAPAPAVEVASSPVPAAADVAAAPAPEVSSSAAPAAPSIDIVV